MIEAFNTPLEIGVRSLAILIAAFPKSLDVQHLVWFDYLTIHSGDIEGGPSSLHAPVPLRSGELLIRSQMLERGILLMQSRGLIKVLASPQGFEYMATDEAEPYFSILTSTYIHELRNRAEWVVHHFANYTTKELMGIERELFGDWSPQFQPRQLPGESI